MPADRPPLEISTLADRPHLAGAELDAGDWPEFMRHNRVSEAYFWRTLDTFPTTCLVATAPDGTVVADAHAVQLAARPALPTGGWEQTAVWAFADAERGVRADTTCALDISVAQPYQRQGVAAAMLAALRQAAADLGHRTLLAPVRPSRKSAEPHTSMRAYAARTRADGLPADPWLRTHVRMGGEIVGIAPASWLIAGSLDEWRRWTSLPFDTAGPIDVPGALVPVHCDPAAGTATYTEPNVWVRHRL
ncbi:N-acetyltransferase [Kribbella sandramycini]|uniref:N-acetyltransferase n=1 Tax=Kribbella sandramycini TaxID=60450 RepID=A0A7Y4L0S4_9ACTN|nr:GNAT family N-acetyltransferase [Kribbella sandramycini]MBB6565172.1 GNAT superfamily N-acetyltransferase [Kribbella sandramycini]NOL41442.1 N-acetyltransferase [Kribbella sandramycini]